MRFLVCYMTIMSTSGLEFEGIILFSIQRFMEFHAVFSCRVLPCREGHIAQSASLLGGRHCAVLPCREGHTAQCIPAWRGTMRRVLLCKEEHTAQCFPAGRDTLHSASLQEGLSAHVASLLGGTHCSVVPCREGHSAQSASL